jgi:sugar O-acyltransferase (sialic acid O-acetyltransferase NeuD family)
MTARTPLVILGTGGNSLDLAETGQLLRDAWEVRGFLDDARRVGEEPLPGLRVLGTLDQARTLDGVRFISGIGSSRSFTGKPALVRRVGVPDSRYATLVHPTASVSRYASLGSGVGILQGATVTVRASIGDHVIVLPSAVVSHDCVVGSHSCIAGGAVLSGGVVLGENCYVGSNASIREGVRLGSGCLIGMGAVVVRDVPPGEVWAGVPARRLGNDR